MRPWTLLRQTVCAVFTLVSPMGAGCGGRSGEEEAAESVDAGAGAGGGADADAGTGTGTGTGVDAGADAGGCPPVFGEGAGQACPVEDTCQYAEGACACLSCWPTDGGASSYWHCHAWTDVGPACPAPAPEPGTPCSAPEGTKCDYAQCCRGPALGASVRCQDGAWQIYVNTTCACSHRCP